ncbi:uncharacterized protein HMPREF1541_07587 [Cyphellophora europaea CBS 101466]|uniref:Sister chromatid cohesion protein Ctf8 n=1 Tax=Cyphellophora europaea (strain CBS 101466) TaxID=1220924 RepID=W2RQH2_CYPE1|nr:uncharacterized protein HMPREF1541_07587 [Cyphellophora europaea CBS 101466]ETN37964.1 hypothetical protein HMPREF1541_07587 [Cyphellophora europaea CBS 101466]
MPAVTLHLEPSHQAHYAVAKSLPTLLSTPSGVAIVEIQGTIHAPFPSPEDDPSSALPTQTAIGHLDFPDYDPMTPDDTKWMKKAYLYVGRNQRLVGEVKKLAKPIAVLRKRGVGESEGEMDRRQQKGEKLDQEALEILEVVKFRILFQGRPEPV